jgi:hypothetical protein
MHALLECAWLRLMTYFNCLAVTDKCFNVLTDYFPTEENKGLPKFQQGFNVIVIAFHLVFLHKSAIPSIDKFFRLVMK